MKYPAGVFKLMLIIGLVIFGFFGCKSPVSTVPLSQSAMPVIDEGNDTVFLGGPTMKAVELTLSSEHHANSVWKIYEVESGGMALNWIVSYYPPNAVQIRTPTDFSKGVYWITVTEKGKSESGRLMISILPFVPDKTAKPSTTATTYTKVQSQERDIRFSLINEYAVPATTSCTVYSGATGDAVHETVTADYFKAANPYMNVLRLNSTSDIPAGIYWVAVTEYGKSESDRLGLTILPYTLPGESATPNSTTNTVVKTASPQKTITITLNSSHPAGTEWRVYNVPEGGAALADVSIGFNTTTKDLTLTASGSDLAGGVYYIAAKEIDKAEESSRFALLVQDYTPSGKSATPVAAAIDTTVPKTALTQTSITFTLSSGHTGTWKVYNASSGGTALTTVSAAFNITTKILTLSVAGGSTDIAAGTYYVSVTENGKSESDRLALTVAAYIQPISATPAASLTEIEKAKTALTQTSIAFTLTSSHTGTWKVYSAASGGTLSTVTAAFNVSTKILTLSASGSDIAAGTYYVSVTETGKTESGRLALAVTAYAAPKSARPAVASSAAAAAAKTAATQKSVSFTLSSSHTGTWRVYTAASGGSASSAVSAAFVTSTRILTLSATGSDITVRTYYVSVTETDKSESDRLALTVGAYIPVVRTPVVRYAVNSAGTAFTATPSSGSTWNAVLNAGAAVKTIDSYRMIDVGSGNGYVDLGSNLGTVFSSLTNFTVETYVMIRRDVDIGGAGNFFWSFSSAASANNNTGKYMWLRSSTQMFAISSGGYNNETKSAGSSAIAKGSWKHVVLTKDNDTYSVYVDGVLIGTATDTDKFGSLGTLNYNYLARPLFSGDAYLKNTLYYQLNVYNTALTQQQIATELGADVLLAQLPYEQTPTPTPVILPQNATVAKTSAVQKVISFIFAAADNGQWSIYAAPSGGQPLQTVSASLYGRVLTLTSSGNDLVPGTYYVSVYADGAGLTESARVALTVAPYEVPAKQIVVNFGGIPDDPVNISGNSTVSKNGGSLTISVADPGRFDSFTWRLNGVTQAGQTTGTYTLNGASLSALANGENRVMVIAWINNVPWSGEAVFTVTN